MKILRLIEVSNCQTRKDDKKTKSLTFVFPLKIIMEKFLF
jgi:hypothetical protein